MHPRSIPIGGRPLNLGTDKAAAVRAVAALIGLADDAGTIGRLWAQYQDTADWAGLTPRTRADYTDYSAPLLAGSPACAFAWATPSAMTAVRIAIARSISPPKDR